MAKWQTIEGDINTYHYKYVSKRGNDTSGTGSSTNPYKTLNKAVTDLNTDASTITRVCVIGSGTYAETISVSRTNTKFINFIGDGLVIFQESGGTSPQFKAISDKATNIVFRDYASTVLQTVYYGTSQSYNNCKFYNMTWGINGDSLANGNYTLPTYNYCILQNVALAVAGRTNILSISMNNCILNNIYNDLGIAAATTCNPTFFTNNIVYNCNNWRLNLAIASNAFNFNCIIGNVLVGTTARNLAWIKANTVTNVNSVGGDTLTIYNPKWNDYLVEDYTLMSDSSLLYAGYQNKHIGPYGRGFSYSAQTLYDNRNDTNTKNIEIVNGKVLLTNGGERSGVLETNVIQLDTVSRRVSLAHLFASIEYDVNGVPSKIIDHEELSYPAYDTTGNTKYYKGDTCTTTDTSTYLCNSLAGTYGVFDSSSWNKYSVTEKSYFYDFELKFSPDSSDLSSLEWKKMLWNYEIKCDASSLGTADSSANLSTLSNVKVRWFQLRMKLTDMTI